MAARKVTKLERDASGRLVLSLDDRGPVMASVLLLFIIYLIVDNALYYCFDWQFPVWFFPMPKGVLRKVEEAVSYRPRTVKASFADPFRGVAAMVRETCPEIPKQVRDDSGGEEEFLKFACTPYLCKDFSSRDDLRRRLKEGLSSIYGYDLAEAV